MRLGTKILLLMLTITIGSSAMVTWIVTRRVTQYESDNANELISLTINRYLRQLDANYQQFSHVVRAMLGDPEPRSLLQAADDPAGAAARAQLGEEVLGRDVQTELASQGAAPAFHVLTNLAHEVVLVAVPGADRRLEKLLSEQVTNWPVDEVIGSRNRPVIRYVSADGKLFMTMGIPLQEQLDEPPTHAYFVGFRIDDNWVRGQLLAEHPAPGSTLIPLEAWFVLDQKVVACGSSDPADTVCGRFNPSGMTRRIDSGKSDRPEVNLVTFDLAGDRFVGQSVDLRGQVRDGKVVLAGSLDQALAPLHALQRYILLTTLIACCIAIVACRAIAWTISRPIRELVAGTRRIAAGRFDTPVLIKRRDELGTLASSFNQMSEGLREREELLQQRAKTERELAVARQIQMDVLPEHLPVCAGYDLAAMSVPAEQTGGDIYDLLTLAAGPRVFILLADATGHGIGPALSVTQVRSMLRIGLRLDASLEDLLWQVNAQLHQDLGSSRFVTAFLGILDPVGHRVSYHSAGQGPLLHFHAKDRRFEWLASSMPPLGVLAGAETDGPHCIMLEPGDCLALLTDGFYEYRDSQRQLFGKTRVMQTVLNFQNRPAAELLGQLYADIQGFAAGELQLDDMTGVIIRRLEA